MTEAWFEQKPALLEEVRGAIAADQPDLHETIVDGVVRLGRRIFRLPAQKGD